jgi:hypothetical protein
MKALLTFIMLLPIAACGRNADGTPAPIDARACQIAKDLHPIAVGMAQTIDYTQQHQAQADALAAGTAVILNDVCSQEVPGANSN